MDFGSSWNSGIFQNLWTEQIDRRKTADTNMRKGRDGWTYVATRWQLIPVDGIIRTRPLAQSSCRARQTGRVRRTAMQAGQVDRQRLPSSGGRRAAGPSKPTNKVNITNRRRADVMLIHRKSLAHPILDGAYVLGYTPIALLPSLGWHISGVAVRALLWKR